MSPAAKPPDEPPPRSALSIVRRLRTDPPFNPVSPVRPQIVRSPNFSPEVPVSRPASARRNDRENSFHRSLPQVRVAKPERLQSSAALLLCAPSRLSSKLVGYGQEPSTR